MATTRTNKREPSIALARVTTAATASAASTSPQRAASHRETMSVSPALPASERSWTVISGVSFSVSIILFFRGAVALLRCAVDPR